MIYEEKLPDWAEYPIKKMTILDTTRAGAGYLTARWVEGKWTKAALINRAHWNKNKTEVIAGWPGLCSSSAVHGYIHPWQSYTDFYLQYSYPHYIRTRLILAAERVSITDIKMGAMRIKVGPIVHLVPYERDVVIKTLLNIAHSSDKEEFPQLKFEEWDSVELRLKLGDMIFDIGVEEFWRRVYKLVPREEVLKDV
jgi:hypothetical protein